jgi:hypothetical protein
MLGTVAFLAALASPGPAAWAQTSGQRTDLAVRPEFREPVTLTSKEGVLEVRLTARQGQATLGVPAYPSLPDYKRGVQFTVNSQFQPEIKSKAGQTEIWVLANVIDVAGSKERSWSS